MGNSKLYFSHLTPSYFDEDSDEHAWVFSINVSSSFLVDGLAIRMKDQDLTVVDFLDFPIIYYFDLSLPSPNIILILGHLSLHGLSVTVSLLSNLLSTIIRVGNIPQIRSSGMLFGLMPIIVPNWTDSEPHGPSY